MYSIIVIKPYRFTSEAKASRHPLAYLPFGAGPRNCPGTRLALLEAKIGMAMVLQKMRFVQCEETKVSDTITHGMNVIFLLSFTNQMIHIVLPLLYQCK